MEKRITVVFNLIGREKEAELVNDVRALADRLERGCDLCGVIYDREGNLLASWEFEK